MTKESNVFLDEKGFFEEIIETLENGYEGWYCDLHGDIFSYGVNADIKDLEEYGVFDAIGEIQEYESNNFGEIYTDLSSPSQVADTLYYIKSSEFLYETLEFNFILDSIANFEGDLWNEKATEEVNKAIIKCLSEEFKNVYC